MSTVITKKGSSITPQQSNKDSVNHENANNDPAYLVTESRLWFRDQYKKMTMLSMALAFVAALSILLNIAQIVFRPMPQYFAQTPDLRITEMTPLSEPYITQQGVTNWVLAVVGKTLSLDFSDWRVKLTEVQPEFYENAFAELVRSMKDAGIIELVKSKRLVMNPLPKA